MGLPRFGPPNPKAAVGDDDGDSNTKKANRVISSPNLYVANCGPAVGLSHDTIASVFASFGHVRGVYAADDSGARVIVCYDNDSCAAAALSALHGRPCPQLASRTLHIRYSVLQPSPATVNSSSVQVCLSASENAIPGLYLLPDFVTPHEEQELLAAVDARPWISLAKRRVQHYGYQFCYQTRNVNTKQHLGALPSFVSPVLERVLSFPNLSDAADVSLDQLTVNEYPPGVGLSPHIDTHSAFEGLIFSLSLAGPCIMEFRRYAQGAWFPKAGSSIDTEPENPENCTNFTRKAIYLPPRSMLLLSGEARLAWHHYIPHHKIDIVNDNVIKRSSRRVSFTLRKVRTGPCQCQFPQYCDSRR
uniref:RNA-binding (RRM/RBD/RNP motifs) family protein n=1 Tax=Erodium trifolium TaxID=337410 RepID=A0A0G4AM63_9ROSI|nr:RNA-binding (RRM/RBD/RNP motifs) family protein [Erodium trifolium]